MGILSQKKGLFIDFSKQMGQVDLCYCTGGSNMAFNSETIECPVEQVDLACPYCHSSRVVKHGRTSARNVRYRCIFCKKTWVQNKVNQPRPDFALLTEAYLTGYSYRDLRLIYRSSPIRINEKIREYLQYCPSWEDYLDACQSKYQPRVIHLVGCRLKCKSSNSMDHSVYLALAIDALSTVVLGFELGSDESKDVWLRLLDRLNCRGIICPTFITYGQKIVNEALGIVFPYSDALHNFTRILHDRELKEEVSRINDPKKVIREAIEACRNDEDSPKECCLELFKDARVKQLVYESKDFFLRRLIERLDQLASLRSEGLVKSFQVRCEKFHMIKNDPFPIVNGWIALWMLEPLPIGFSRLSLYLQYPCETHFRNFGCGILPKRLDLPVDSQEMKTFAVELAVRRLQMPV